VALVDGVPKTLSLLELIRHYLVYQREVVNAAVEVRAAPGEKRAHVLEGSSRRSTRSTQSLR